MPPQKEKGEPTGPPRLSPPLRIWRRRSLEREPPCARHQLQSVAGSAAQLRAEPPVAVAVGAAQLPPKETPLTSTLEMMVAMGLAALVEA